MEHIAVLIKNAMLSKDNVALNAYKNLKAEFDKFIHSPKYNNSFSQSDALQITVSYCKKLEDSISQFKQANREDLIQEYTSELEVLQKLIPEPPTAEEIEYILYNWADELNYYGQILEDRMEIIIPKKEMGNAIKHLKMRFPTADGKLISDIVKKYIK